MYIQTPSPFNPCLLPGCLQLFVCAGGGVGGHHGFGSGPTQGGGVGGLFAKGFALHGWGRLFASIPGLGRNKSSWESSSLTFLFGGGYGGGSGRLGMLCCAGFRKPIGCCFAKLCITLNSGAFPRFSVGMGELRAASALDSGADLATRCFFASGLQGHTKKQIN